MRDPEIFSSKAGTLRALAPRLRRSYVLPLVSFSTQRWRRERASVLKQIVAELGSGPLIVRSSARSEDGFLASGAGAHLSLTDIDADDPEAISTAINAVVASYRETDAADEVLVQPQLRDIRLSGVLFTRDLSTLAPYRVFDYDDSGTSTSSVTSGQSCDHRSYVRFRGTSRPYPSPELERVFEAVEEIESLTGSDQVEIELALDGEGRVCLFQARPLVGAEAASQTDERLAACLFKIESKVRKLSGPHPHLYGSRSVFGVMPDWNPAEIIGLRPRGLAMSLYKELVTDSVWAYQRRNYGYRDLRSFPLMISLLGIPFIDVRVSFNSFVPGSLRIDLCEKLVNYYVDRLVQAPQSHDKVEFEIVFSCSFPGIRSRIAVLENHGFTGAEVGELLSALRDVTNGVIHPDHGLYLTDLRRIEELAERHSSTVNGDLPIIDEIYWLVEDCKRWGTLPFSGLARAAFIAVQFLRGLVEAGALTREDQDRFLLSLDTVANQMGRALGAVARGERTLADFQLEYGHLRPGTYDVTTPRYDQAPERYFGDLSELRDVEPEKPDFNLSPAQDKEVARVLQTEGLQTTPRKLFEFMKQSIEGREHAKLLFTRSLSDILERCAQLGERYAGLDREDISHLDVRTVLDCYGRVDSRDLADILGSSIAANKAEHEISRAIQLPNLLVDPEGIYHFELSGAEPSFVTNGRISAEVVAEIDLYVRPLQGRIVFIRSADPGFDWIFSKRIGGLVTMMGGGNSHMAIRAAEQGIPAVIGCGEVNFRRWSRAAQLLVDCANRSVAVVR